MELNLTPDPKKAKGGLRGFSFAKTDNRVSTGGDGNGGAWSKTWESRMKGFPFRLAKNSEAQIVFLSDVTTFPSYEVAYKWLETSKGSFPATDYVRAEAYEFGEDGIEYTGRVDLYEKILGKSPRIVGMAAILDLTPWTHKTTGKKHLYSIRPIFIKQESILASLAQTSAIEERDLQYSVFKITRTNGDKTPAIGDAWNFVKYVEPEHLIKMVNDSIASTEGVDPETKLTLEKLQGFAPIHSWMPEHTPEEQTQLLTLHHRVLDKHGESSIDEDLLKQAQAGNYAPFQDGVADTGSSDPLDIGGAAEPTVTPASSGGGLSDLDEGDDIYGEGNQSSMDNISI